MSPIHIAKVKSFLHILPKMASRHGLIAGATGTGKTTSRSDSVLENEAKLTARAALFVVFWMGYSGVNNWVILYVN